MSLFRGGLWKRLPFLVFVGIGIFLWRGGFGLLPSEREVWWSLEGVPDRATSVELTLRDERGALLKLDRISLQAGPSRAREVRQTVIVKAGSLRASLAADVPGAAPFRREQSVRVEEGSDPLYLSLAK